MDDPEILINLLQIKEVSVVGVIIVALALFFLGIKTKAIYLSGTHDALMASSATDLQNCNKKCDTCTSAMEVAQLTIKQCEKDYTDARISIARFEERENLTRQWQPSPPSQRG